MKLRNLLTGAFVVGLGAAAGPAAAQPETAESLDLERLQAPAQTIEVADVNSGPMCDFPPVRTVASNNFFQPGPFGERTPCWHPMFGPAPLLG